MDKLTKVAGAVSAFLGGMVLFAAVAMAQTAPTASTIATDTATGIRDQFLPAMVVAIPIVLTVVVAKRVFRWVKGN